MKKVAKIATFFVIGGGDGSRTRVQKAIHGSIYKFSLSTTFPHTQADKQAG